MKKRWVFGLGLAALLAGGAALRWWKRRAAFEPDTELLIPGHPATWCLVGLLAAAGAFFLFLSLWCARSAPGSYLAAFALPRRVLLAVYLLAGGLLVGAGLLGLMDFRSGLYGQTSRLIFSVALLPAGLGLALVGWLNAQRQEAQGRFAWPLLLPGYCGCLWIISAYQANTAQPNVMAYAPYLLGAVCAVICCYAVAAFSFEKPLAVWTVWTGGMALVLLGVKLTDCAWAAARAGDPAAALTAAQADALTAARFDGLVCLGYMLYLAAQLKCLLTRCDDPAELEPWTPPAEDAPEDPDTHDVEVKNHE